MARSSVFSSSIISKPPWTSINHKWLSSCTNLWKSILGEHFEVTEVNLKTLLGVITQPSQQEIFPLTIHVTSIVEMEGAELKKCIFLPILSYYNIILLIIIWFIDFWKQQNSVNWTPNSGWPCPLASGITAIKLQQVTSAPSKSTSVVILLTVVITTNQARR